MVQEDHRGGAQQPEKAAVGAVSGQGLGPPQGGAQAGRRGLQPGGPKNIRHGLPFSRGQGVS